MYDFLIFYQQSDNFYRCSIYQFKETEVSELKHTVRIKNSRGNRIHCDRPAT